MRRHVLTVLACLLVLPTVAASTAPASAAPPHRASANDIEDEVMCVACGVALDIAESPQANRERRYIEDLVNQGKTKQQVLDALVATYGDRVLATPKDSGFGLVSYLVPIALALIAIAAGLFFVPKWRRTRTDGTTIVADGPALSDADARRLDEDLARYER
jgi:cytochrome c-type biogenesis protein CcmH